MSKNKQPVNKRWTEEEDNFLREKAPDVYYDDLVKLVPNRSRAAIIARISKLKIKRNVNEHSRAMKKSKNKLFNTTVTEDYSEMNKLVNTPLGLAKILKGYENSFLVEVVNTGNKTLCNREKVTPLEE